MFLFLFFKQNGKNVFQLHAFVHRPVLFAFPFAKATFSMIRFFVFIRNYFGRYFILGSRLVGVIDQKYWKTSTINKSHNHTFIFKYILLK